jgi:hypothetical protein
VSTALTGERAPSRWSDSVSDPPSDTHTDGVGVGKGNSTSQLTPTPSVPPDSLAEGSPGWRGQAAYAPASAFVPRFLVDLYGAVRDLGSAGAARNARAALLELQGDAEELTRVGMLTESAVAHLAASRSYARSGGTPLA